MKIGQEAGTEMTPHFASEKIEGPSGKRQAKVTGEQNVEMCLASRCVRPHCLHHLWA